MFPFKFRKNLAKNFLHLVMRSLREASEASSSGKDFYPIQGRETQKAAVSSTHFQIRSEAHGAYIMLAAAILCTIYPLLKLSPMFSHVLNIQRIQVVLVLKEFLIKFFPFLICSLLNPPNEFSSLVPVTRHHFVRKLVDS